MIQKVVACFCLLYFCMAPVLPVRADALSQDGSRASAGRTEVKVQVEAPTETPGGMLGGEKESRQDVRGCIVHVDEDGSFHEPETVRAGKQLTVMTNTLGSFGLVRTGAKASQKLKSKYTALKRKMGAAKVTQTVSGAKTKVTFTSSDPKVAAVGRKGKIRFLSVGTAYITASAAEDENYQSASLRCKATVIPKTAGVKSLVSGKRAR